MAIRKGITMQDVFCYKKILLVEDDVDFQNVIASYLHREHGQDIKIDIVDCSIEALLRIALSDGQYDLAIVDHRLKGKISGLFLCIEIARKYPKIHLIMLSGISVNEFISLTKKKIGIPKFLSKPFSPRELDAVLMDLSTEKHNKYKAAS